MPRTTKSYVRDVRLATVNDIAKIESAIVEIATYDISLLDKIKSMSADDVSRFMRGQKANNERIEDAVISDGFVSMFDVMKSTDKLYYDIGGHDVTVVSVKDGKKGKITGKVKGIDGYVVFVAINDSTVIMCPCQENADCWFFE